MKLTTTFALAGSTVLLAACVPDYGTNPGGPPAPIAAPEPAALPGSFAPTRRNYVQVSGNPGNGSGATNICLTNSVRFDKGFAVGGGSMIAVERGQRKCVQTSSSSANVTFYTRAAGLGGLKERTSHNINLTGWGGGTVEMDWTGE